MALTGSPIDVVVRADLRVDVVPVDLDITELELARRVRAAARVVGAAGLPSEHRPTAFRAILEHELERIRA